MADPDTKVDPASEINDGNPSDGKFSDEGLRVLFAPLADFKTVVVAVSGGADSVALLRLLHRWQALVGEPPILEVATIDHGLRTESANEARWVCELATTLGLRHTAKRWIGEKPLSGLQSAAREARYNLLQEICRDYNFGAPVAIATAHTRDDQAETVVMRLARGSGVDGLGAMAELRLLKQQDQGARNPITLARPLLDISKQDLVTFLQANGQAWLEDPSNASRDFERVRLRHTMPSLSSLGVTPASLAKTAWRARRARNALDQSALDFIERRCALNDGAVAVLPLAALQAAPDEIQIRVLARLLSCFGGVASDARLSQVEALQASWRANMRIRATTLGGCVIDKRGSELRIFRESGRDPLPDIHLQPGQSILWDQRFMVSAAADPAVSNTETDLHVRPLDPTTYTAIRGALEGDGALVSSAIAQTLPSFWLGEVLLAVPTLGYWAVPTGHGPCNAPVRAEFVGVAGHRIGT